MPFPLEAAQPKTCERALAGPRRHCHASRWFCNSFALERDDFLRAIISLQVLVWRVIFSENRYPLFGITR
jgi:hypothetical protein